MSDMYRPSTPEAKARREKVDKLVLDAVRQGNHKFASIDAHARRGGVSYRETDRSLQRLRRAGWLSFDSKQHWREIPR